MFNPRTQHHQQQQQQQYHQHLRQIQHLFHQPPPPPPPRPPSAPPQPTPAHHVGHHHHQATRAITVPPHTATPPPRMVNLCQATQSTVISPNPMLQGALMMQQMQGNMRGFGIAGQQFCQFFTSANRSLLGPVPMGIAMKSPLVGFPAAARPFQPSHRCYYNNAVLTTTATSIASTSSVTDTSTDAVTPQPEKKCDSKQMVDGCTDDIAADNKAKETETDGVVKWVDESPRSFEEQNEEPALKRKKMEGSEDPQQDPLLNDCVILEEDGGTPGSRAADRVEDSHATVMGETDPSHKQDVEGSAAEGANKFYCYLCTITCHSQENFRSHMNSVSHQQRMMEIQHMSNACLVTLLPRLHETLQGASKDGEKKDTQRWCATCCAHYSISILDHRRTEEHRLASQAAVLSCSVCKKHFRSSKLFVAHLQTQEHQQRIEKEIESWGLSLKLPGRVDGVEIEEEKEDDRLDPNEEDLDPENQDGWSLGKEVTLKDMARDEQHDPGTIYGSSFFMPVAGFICRLCNKFYHFDSSALHTHCKSLKHFENLKRHKESVSEQRNNTDIDGSSLTGAITDSLERDFLSSTTESTSKLSGTQGTKNQLPFDIAHLPVCTDNTNEEETMKNRP
ncbi:cdkn1a interacting zinc finger protein 1a [Corythoichthys intestinalis]|uniref:cdkn1a interacting zinc finger protein 1a n=1 Tax=Corythoichthys intestinalis TaxID=161448 RepID=UPI0025A680AC|nr:cdkn1a interacting zinc finger protein 1a [Corythoichthys intestinalis]XP_057675691.1 cdkn1a interacting zinc finger protein 1a [Corythoichthys intestinalis]